MSPIPTVQRCGVPFRPVTVAVKGNPSITVLLLPRPGPPVTLMICAVAVSDNANTTNIDKENFLIVMNLGLIMKCFDPLIA